MNIRQGSVQAAFMHALHRRCIVCFTHACLVGKAPASVFHPVAQGHSGALVPAAPLLAAPEDPVRRRVGDLNDSGVARGSECLLE
jgi:hypothetical protein